MKKHLVFFIFVVLYLLLTFNYSSAQKYYPLVDTNKVWSIIFIVASPGEPKLYYNIKFTNDTIINGNIYKKVMEAQYNFTTKLNWINEGSIRETPDKKVYLMKGSSEWLLYNFNVKKGDTIYANYSILIVDSLNYIQLGKQLRKRYYLHVRNTPEKDIWIEGIGSLNGILNPGQHIMGAGESFLLCFIENDTLKYKNPEYDYCYYETVNVNDVRSKKSEVRIYPNPANSFINIEWGMKENDKVSINISDITGREIKELGIKNYELGIKSIKYDVSKLRNGVYFVHFKSNSINQSMKFVVIK